MLPSSLVEQTSGLDMLSSCKVMVIEKEITKRIIKLISQAEYDTKAGKEVKTMSALQDKWARAKAGDKCPEPGCDGTLALEWH